MNESLPNNEGAGESLPEQGDAGDKTLWEELGIPAPASPDASRPLSMEEQELLRAFVRGELAVETRRKVHLLVDTDPNWAAGHVVALEERARSPEFRATFDAELRRLADEKKSDA